MPGEQGVLFGEGKGKQAAFRALHTRTMLDAWFEVARTSTEGDLDDVRYHELPGRCCWDAKGKKWQRRERGAKAGDVSGRLYNSKLNAGEVYYLRQLLQHVPAKDLRRGDNGWQALALAGGGQDEAVRQSHTPFQDACRRLGLLQDDVGSASRLKEAVAVQTCNV